MLRSQENLILENLYYDIIEEGRKERYLEMFRDPYFDETEMPRVKRIITHAVNHLNNPNAITWILKQYRDGVIKTDDDSLAARIYMLTKSRIERLAHYENLGIRQINTFNWPKDASYNEIIDHFNALEKKWLGDRKEWVDITDELRNGEIEKIMDVGNDFAWYNLNRNYCRAEGDAMGHCGNSGSYTINDTVFSLRKTQKRGNRVFARPSLTFIYNTNTKSLGEMKGRANEKPKPIYHPYILKLLAHKINDSEFLINRIRGGGYKPENNFQIADLSSVLKDQLYRIRPDWKDMKSFKEIRVEVQNDQEFYNIIESRLSQMFPKYSVKVFEAQGVARVRFDNLWRDWEDLFNNINIPRRLDEYMKYVEGSEIFEVNVEEVDEDDMKRLFARAMNDSITERRITEHIKENYDENYSPNQYTESETFELLQDNNDDIIDNLRDAIRNGYESGSYNQMLEYFKDGIEDLSIFLEDGISVSIQFENAQSWMTSNISGVVFMSDLLISESNLDSDSFERIDDVEGDMTVPYYGFDHYDRDAALDYFKSELRI